MDHEDPNLEPQQPELGESIDELLDEIDASRAQTDAPIEASIDEQSGADSDSVTQAQTGEDDQVGKEALDALDAVSQNAEALLEDTIGELLNEQDATQDAAEHVDEEGQADDDLLAGIADELIDGTQGEESTPEATENTSLDGIEDIIEIDDLDDDFLSALAEESAVESTDEPAGEHVDEVESEDASEDVEQLLESLNQDLNTDAQADEGIEDAQEEPQEETEAVAEEVTEEVAVEVEEEVEEIAAESNDDTTEATTQAEIDEQPSSEPEETPSSELDDLGLGDLDDALASVGDDLLMGDFETVDGDLVDSDFLDESIDPSLLLDSLELDAAVSEIADGNKPDTTPEPEPETQAPNEQADEQAVAEAQTPLESSPETPSKPAPEPTKTPQAQAVDKPVKPRVSVNAKPALEHADNTLSSLSPDDEVVESIWERLFHVCQARGKQFRNFAVTKGMPMSAKAIFTLSRPLHSKPAKVRDSIGYIAIWTLFLATVLWVYTMFFRTTPTPVPSKAPTRVVTPDDDLERIENQMPAELP